MIDTEGMETKEIEMAEHTPGPWKVGRPMNPPQQVIGPVDPNQKPAFLALTCGGNDEANAQLIAAAPDMLAALELPSLFYSVEWTEGRKTRWKQITGLAEATTRIMCDHIRKVIAKAKGAAQ